MDAELPEIADMVKIEALSFSIAGVAGDPNSLNSIIDAIFSGRTEIEAGIEKKQLMPFLETLEVINLACSAKANYSGWEFEPIRHSVVEGAQSQSFLQQYKRKACLHSICMWRTLNCCLGLTDCILLD